MLLLSKCKEIGLSILIARPSVSLIACHLTLRTVKRLDTVAASQQGGPHERPPRSLHSASDRRDAVGVRVSAALTKATHMALRAPLRHLELRAAVGAGAGQ